MKYVAGGKCRGREGVEVDADSVPCFIASSAHVRRVVPASMLPDRDRLVEVWHCDCGRSGITYTDVGERSSWLAYAFEKRGERRRHEQNALRPDALQRWASSTDGA